MKKKSPFLAFIVVAIFSLVGCADNSLRLQLTNAQAELKIYKDSVKTLGDIYLKKTGVFAKGPDGESVLVKDTAAYSRYLSRMQSVKILYDKLLEKSAYEKYGKLLARTEDADFQQQLYALSWLVSSPAYPHAKQLMFHAFAEKMLTYYETPEKIDLQFDEFFADSAFQELNRYQSPEVETYRNKQYDIIGSILKTTRPQEKQAWSLFLIENK